MDSSESDRDVVLQFESLGGSGHGCEFGIFQREHGAEPLGLLRWSDLNEGQLTQALLTGFAGVGSPEFTQIFEPGADHHDEWWTTDTRFHMAMRTFVKVADVSRDDMVNLVAKRSEFLRNKLIADLTSGEKIFVFRNMFANLTEKTLATLHQAIRSYGSNIFLYLAYADDDHPHGSIEYKNNDLVVAYVEHFSFSRENTYIGPPWPALLKICREVVRLKKNKIIPLVTRDGCEQLLPNRTQQCLELTEQELISIVQSRSFSFGRINGPKYADNIILRANKTISGYTSYNESSWSVRNNAVVFHDKDGGPATVFDKVYHGLRGYELRGRFKGADAPYEHVMIENVPSRHGFASVVDVSCRQMSPKFDAVVLVRSCECDQKFKDLMSKLNKGRSQFDLFAIVDESRGHADPGTFNVVWHSVETCRKLGLTQSTRPQELLHRCGDFPLYFALRELPTYKYYIMIEDDVDLTSGDASFLNNLVQTLKDRSDQIDIAGINLHHDPHGTWTDATEKVFGLPNCFYMTFPFMVFSKRLVSYLFSQRLLEAARGVFPEDVMHCEGFAISAAVAGGFTYVDLKYLIPNSYDQSMMLHSGSLGWGRPLGFSPLGAPPPDIIHPVYGHPEFVRRLRDKFHNNTSVTREFVDSVVSACRMAKMDKNHLNEIHELFSYVPGYIDAHSDV